MATFLTRDRREPSSSSEEAGAPDYWFGVDIGRVREIGRIDRISPVPLAPPAVLGLCNLRGQLVTVLDLGACLGVGRGPELAGHERAPCIILKTDRERGLPADEAGGNDLIGLRVDEVGDLVEVSEHDIEPAPGHVSTDARTLLGIVRFPQRSLVLLNLEEVLRAGGETHSERLQSTKEGPPCA